MRVAAGSRRASYARHELRFSSRHVAVAGACTVGVVALAFASGLLVGRELGPLTGGHREAGSPSAPRADRPAAGAAEAPGAPAEERLTFYKTLTAPIVEPEAVPAPRVEERLVATPAPSAPPRVSPRSTPPPPSRPTASPARPEPVLRARAAASPPNLPPASPQVGQEPQLWTIQVSSFRTRALADDLRARLATRGFDAYLISVATEEGRVRYRVRVGTYASRGEAERVSSELRGERNLNPFVTPKGR